MTVVYSTDEQGLWLYEYSRASLRKAVPDAKVVLMSDFDGSSADATVLNVSGLLRSVGIYDLWSRRTTRFTPMSAARLVIPLCPELSSESRILYLDTDTLVLSGERLLDAYRTPFGDSDVLGVRDDVPPHFLSRENFRNEKLMNALRGTKAIEGAEGNLVANMAECRYVNSGVLVYNLEKIVPCYGRTIGYIRRIMERHDFKFFDQDVTNILFRTGDLDPSANDMVMGHGFVPYEDTAVAHYAGGRLAKEEFQRAAEELLR